MPRHGHIDLFSWSRALRVLDGWFRGSLQCAAKKDRIFAVYRDFFHNINDRSKLFIKSENLKPKVILRHGDSSEELKKIRRKFDLVLTSPGYNVEKEYESKKSIEEYLENQKGIIERAVQLTNDNGSICWQVGSYINKRTSEVFPLDIFYYQIFKDFGLKLRNRIVWTFGHGLHAKHKFSGRYETILWFTKSDDYIFNLDNIRVPAKYPGKRYHRGPKKGEISGNPLGKNPTDIWKVLLDDWEKEVWEIPNVKANHVEKTGHPCQFPVELAERCILALTNTNSWVLDPYVGVCSTPIAAIKNNRNCLGIDKEERYLNVGIERINKFRNDELKLRPLERPIFEPSGTNLAVAKKPDHFQY